MTTKVELKNVRKVIHEAVNIVGDAVGATMGPGGQCVLLETQAGMPIITKDGVTVANAIEFENQELNIVGKIIKQAADKTNKEAGDGTTTATVLAKEIYNQGYQLIAAGYNSNVLKKQMDLAKAKILNSLDQLSTKIKEESLEETLTHIARISLNGDEEMAKIVAESVVKTGINGLVKVVDNTIAQDEIVSVKGLQFPAGWASPFFADSRDDQKVTLENCAILITSHKLTTLHQLAALEQTLTYFMQKNIPVLFIASEVSGPFLTNLVANQKKGSLKNCALRPPYFGMVRKEFFTDLAAATGGTVIEAEEKMDLSAVEVKHFGYAKRVEVTNLDTTIIEGSGTKEVLTIRINKLKELAEKVDKDQDLDKVNERLAKLLGSVVLIKTARKSQVEAEERKHRIEDALNAAKAALEEGYVSGGGAALYYASRDLEVSDIPGEKLLAKALQFPAKKILLNAGFSEKEVSILDKGETAITVNAVSGKPVNAYNYGIIDPVKVTKCAVDNAISVAGTLLTTDVIISKNPANTPIMPYEMY